MLKANTSDRYGGCQSTNLRIRPRFNIARWPLQGSTKHAGLAGVNRVLGALAIVSDNNKPLLPLYSNGF